MSAIQRMKVANERHSKTITQRGHVQKTSVGSGSTYSVSPVLLILASLLTASSVCVAAIFQIIQSIRHGM
uniref:Stress-associated endoplasmic reticulum protein n=1 Tax=Cyprinodon variegatus TaxID=28743 RepID=A0A3Q2D2Y6_CYPVA